MYRDGETNGHKSGIVMSWQNSPLLAASRTFHDAFSFNDFGLPNSMPPLSGAKSDAIESFARDGCGAVLGDVEELSSQMCPAEGERDGLGLTLGSPLKSLPNVA